MEPSNLSPECCGAVKCPRVSKNTVPPSMLVLLNVVSSDDSESTLGLEEARKLCRERLLSHTVH